MNLVALLTPVACVVLIVRTAICWPSVSWPEIVGLVLCLLILEARAFPWFQVSNVGDPEQDNSNREIKEIKNDIALLSSKLAGVDLHLGITRVDVKG